MVSNIDIRGSNVTGLDSSRSIGEKEKTLDFDDALEEHKKKEKPIGYAVTCFPMGCVTNVTEVKSSLGSPFV